jgi:hypothetical protein
MLDGWSNFFTLTGSAGATLVGLLFIVITLNTDLSTSRTLDIARASMTPALYSFSGVMIQSMVAVVPWRSNLPGGVIFVLLGIGGVIYRINAPSQGHPRAGRLDLSQRGSGRLQRHPDSRRCGIGRRGGFRPVRHRGVEHAPLGLRDLPDLGRDAGVDRDARQVLATGLGPAPSYALTFPLSGLPGAPRSVSRRPAGTQAAGGVPQTSAVTVIVVRVDGQKQG